jgi:nitrous oxidase accessory protein
VTKCFLSYVYAIAVLTLSGASVVPAFGTTIRVSPDGPISSVTEAVNSASPGDTISVEGGVYHERIVVDKTLT